MPVAAAALASRGDFFPSGFICRLHALDNAGDFSALDGE